MRLRPQRGDGPLPLAGPPPLVGRLKEEAVKHRYITPTEDAIVRAAYAWRQAESHKEEIQRLRELRNAVYADLDAGEVIAAKAEKRLTSRRARRAK